jgi:two-component system, NtrC family, sensor histidine kinase HydH
VSRWPLIAAPLLMGGALCFATWSTYATVGEASALLVRGQAEVFHDRVRGEQISLRRDPDGDALRTLYGDLAEQGLTWVALVDGRGVIVVEAGAPVERVGLEPAIAGARDGEPVTVGDRVRVVFRGPSRRRPMRDGTLRVAPAVVLELEPRAARELETRAGRALFVGLAAAATFFAAAAASIAWMMRRDARERKLDEERRLATLGRMSAVLAHEIKNPLASLKGNAQLLQRGLPEGEKSRGKADRVVGEAIRLEKLIDDLLGFARTGQVHRVEVDPLAVVREAVTSDRVDVRGSAPRWRLDPDRLRQVVVNLVDNALQAGDGRVKVTLGVADGRLRLEVRDRGAGIAADDLPHLFEPFFTRRTQGTGLGLAVARRIVELHDGTITAANGADGGAVFTVLLPK